jgi:hypothetical protein
MKNPKIKLFLLLSPLTLAIVIAASPSVFKVGYPGYQNIFFLAAAWVFLTIGGAWTWEKIIRSTWVGLTKAERAKIFSFSAIFTILLVVMVFIRKYFERPFYYSLIYTPLLLVALFSITCWITMLMIAFRALPGSKKPVRLVWLTLPMLTVWSIYLLTFWPGLSSYDTMQQLREAQAGVFTDAHPAIHTMFIALVSQVFPTPAAIAVIQILTLALVTAWGLVELNRRGLPAWATWSVAFGFALLPVNSLLVITLWKDILYGCALFAVFIQFIKIVLSQGAWLNQKRNLFGFILAGLAASFLRHNGFPVIITSLLVLSFSYRKQWKGILGSILILSCIYFLIRGPFYDFMKVKKYPAFINILMFDHIGAHIKAGTPLEKGDMAYLDELIPLEKWPYKCYDSEIRNMDGPIPFDTFSIPDPRPMQIALKLFLKNPGVDLRHTLCAGGLIWRVEPGYPIYTLPMAGRNYGQLDELGIIANPILPGLLYLLPVPPSDNPVIWRPAFYLLILLFCVPVFALRGRVKKFLLILVPILIQTLVMILVNYARDFRYMFSTELSALLAIGLLFLPLSELPKNDERHLEDDH